MCSESSVLKYFKLILLLVIISCSVTASQDALNMTIPLDEPITYKNKQLYKSFIRVNSSSTLQVNFSNVRKNISFIVFQVHSHLHNISLYKNALDKTSTVIGTNLGLYSAIGKKPDTFYIVNDNSIDLKLFVSVQGYLQTDPIPGGCNMEFPIEISPFMIADVSPDYITVDFAPAMIDAKCLELSDVNYYVYMVYLPEQDWGSDAYFSMLNSTITFMDLENIGTLVPQPTKPPYNRRTVASYPGTGVMFFAVAYQINNGKYNIAYYVPTSTYACSPLEEDCVLLEDTLLEFLCASLFFIGLFICYFGHRFFKSQTFFIGFLSGLVVTYILISLIVTLDSSALILASAISGICVGAIRVVCWWLYGLPIFSIILSSADIGFLTSCVLYNSFPSSVSYLREDYNFWPLFLLISLLITLLLISISFIANLVCCATIGAYATIYPIDFYLGSNMKYILINVIRRATVTNFKNAMLMPPFQGKDIFLSCLWVFLSVTGFMYQYHQNKGKPPFPPPPRSIRAVPEEPADICPAGYRSLSREISSAATANERTPLLA